MNFWARNIGTSGRVIRLLMGIVLLVAAFYFHQQGARVWPWLLGIAGAFGVFEAMRGWCLLRACKIKVPW